MWTSTLELDTFGLKYPLWMGSVVSELKPGRLELPFTPQLEDAKLKNNISNPEPSFVSMR